MCLHVNSESGNILFSSYFKLFLFVALRSVPLNDGLANVQQKHISKVEALPAHLHLKQIETLSRLSSDVT